MNTVMKRRIRRNVPLYLMFIPGLVFYIVIKFIPMAGVMLAFKEYYLILGLWDSPWVGWDNFNTLFTFPQTVQVIRNTLVLSMLTVFVGFPFPVILALLLNEVRVRWFKKGVQTLVFMPHFFSWVIVGGLVVTLFAQEGGTINKLLAPVLGHTVSFLYEEVPWIGIYLGSGIWKDSGYAAIVYIAAISTINPSLYEAAAIDGAGKMKQLWHVTLPGIRSTIIIMLILSVGQVMEVGFDKIYNLQNGAVSSISEVISTYIYRIGLQGGDFGLATAMGLFESLTGFVLVLIANQIARKFDQSLW